jgi:hypothetical protein
MDSQTAKLALTQRRCFKEDAPRIRRLGKVLADREKAGRFNAEHVIRRALNALALQLGISAEVVSTPLSDIELASATTLTKT